MERQQAEVFADTVRRAREARGLSIRKAAEAGGVSDTTWRRLEDVEQLGVYEPRPSTLRAVAVALRLKVDQVHHWAGSTYAGIDEPKSLEAALVELDGQRDQLPAALMGTWTDLTDEQRQRVVGYAEALRQEHHQS